MTTPIPPTNHPDVVLVGAGIMSATLAVILKELDPSLKIEIYEVLGSEAQESSNAWNNAGTGHAALCELNYTPIKVTAASTFPRPCRSTLSSIFPVSSGPILQNGERSKTLSHLFIPSLTVVLCADQRMSRF
jgi:hypothetical protein